jgi:hypothetical protein
VVNVDGILVTTPACTLQDLARTESREIAVCAAESTMRKKLLTPEDIAALPVPTSPSPWLLVDPLAQTPIETLVRLPLVDAEIGPLVSQYEVVTASGIKLAAIDLALPLYRIGLEADGRERHDEDSGFIWDRRRDVLLAEEGWIIIRFSWQTLFDRRTSFRPSAVPSSEYAGSTCSPSDSDQSSGPEFRTCDAASDPYAGAAPNPP